MPKVSRTEEVKAKVHETYLGKMLQWEEYAMQAAIAGDVRTLYIIAKALSSMIPEHPRFNRVEFLKQVNELYEQTFNVSWMTEAEKRHKLNMIADSIYDKIVEAVSPIISSFAAELKTLPTYEVKYNEKVEA